MANEDDGTVGQPDGAPSDGDLTGADAGDGVPALESPASASEAARLEFMKCAGDASIFINDHLTIDDAQGHGGSGGTMPFHLWPSQVAVVWSLMGDRLLCVLKARQLGISWICCAYVLWRCIFQPGQMILLFSRGQDEANELLRRVRVLYERMPEWLKEEGPLAKPPNTSEMEWVNGSRVKSLPATRHGGSGWTASLVIMDEAAKIQFADDLYTALKPTIDGGGQLVVVSTANGIGNLFHNLWTKAVAEENSFKSIFLPWWARPGRDRAWYSARIAESPDPRKVFQEYPESANQAFLVSGRPRFDPDWIAAQAENVWASGVPFKALPEDLRIVNPATGLIVYELPKEGRRYQIGADVAEGLETGDYSDAVVLDCETWEEVASLHGHWEPDTFARYLQSLSDVYDANIAVERNNHGHAVLTSLKFLGCHRISRGHDDKPGWLTNVLTKPQMIDLLAIALRDGLIKVRTQAALDELQIYRIEADGDTSAPDGYNDDRVISRAIALAILRRPNPSYVLGRAIPVPKLLPRPRHSDADGPADWDRHESDDEEAEKDRSRSLPTAASVPADETRAVPGRFTGVGFNRPRRNFYGR